MVATDSTITINGDRLRDDIEALAAIGRDPQDHGVHRPAFSPECQEAEAFVQGQLEAAGARTFRDEALNLHGVLGLEAGVEPARVGLEGPPSVMCGSHLDSVPGGGHLDGALGVLAGVEAVRRIRELGLPLAHPIEVVAFADEEGRFGGMFGSQALSGQLTPASLMHAKDLDGVALVDVLEGLGLEPMHCLRANRAPQTVKAFVELHIEQGPVLDREGLRLGVVEGIVGLFKWNVRLKGQANHAGTTPMSMRADAFQGLAEFATEVGRVLEEDGGQDSVATIGRVELRPGAANVVPSSVEFSLEARDVNPDVLAELANGFRRALSAIARRRGLMFEFDVMSEIDPVRCDPTLQEVITGVVRDLDQPVRALPSGAAHDAQMMADLAPMGMIFVPSKDGRSHSAAEWTAWEAIELGANCLLNTLYRLAKA